MIFFPAFDGHMCVDLMSTCVWMRGCQDSGSESSDSAKEDGDCVCESGSDSAEHKKKKKKTNKKKTHEVGSRSSFLVGCETYDHGCLKML